MKKALRFFAIFLFVFFILALLFANMALTPCSTNAEKITFYIEPGENVAQITSNLFQAGLINNKIIFQMLCCMSGKHSIKSGKYELSSSMPPIKILRLLLKGTSPSLGKSSVK